MDWLPIETALPLSVLFKNEKLKTGVHLILFAQLESLTEVRSLFFGEYWKYFLHRIEKQDKTW